MNRLRNILFSTLVLLTFSTAIVYKIADVADFLPDKLDNGAFSYLEGAQLQSFPDISLDSFIDGTFQDESEAYLSGCWPARDTSLLFNSALQRIFITVADFPWNFDAIPSYYGSGQAYLKESDSITNLMSKNTSEFQNKLQDAVDSYSSFARNHPEYRIAFYIPDKSNITPTSPLTNLQSNVYTWNTLDGCFLEKLDDSIIAIINNVPAENTKEFYELYFKTDHHWNMKGAYKGYLNIAHALGLTDCISATNLKISSIPMYGSYSRSAMMFPNTPDHIIDFEFNTDLNSYEVESGSTSGDTSLLANTKIMSDPSTASNILLRDRYAEYFPYRNAYLTCIHNPDQTNGRSLLIVGDSFSRPIDRLFAYHYENTYNFDPRSTESVTIDNILEKYSIDDILFLETNEAVTMEAYLNALK